MYRKANTWKRKRIFFCIYSDESAEELLIQSDNIHLFDTVNVNTCDQTCDVQDIVGKVELNTNGFDSGCNLEQCCMYLIEKIKYIRTNFYLF